MKIYVVMECDGDKDYIVEIFKNEIDAQEFVEDINNYEVYQNLYYREFDVK